MTNFLTPFVSLLEVGLTADWLIAFISFVIVVLCFKFLKDTLARLV